MENNNPKIPYTVTMDITIQIKMLVDSEDSFQASKDGARFLIGELSTESFHLDSFYDKVTLKDIKVTDCQYLGKVEKPVDKEVKFTYVGENNGGFVEEFEQEREPEPPDTSEAGSPAGW